MPPAPVLYSLEEGLRSWVSSDSFHSCQSCCYLQPWFSSSSSPLLGYTELHPGHSPTGRHPPFAGIFFNLKQVPGIPAESTLPPTRPLPRRLLSCLFREAESPAQGFCLTQVPRSRGPGTTQTEAQAPCTGSISKFARPPITTVALVPGFCGPPNLPQDSVMSSHLDPQAR